MTANNPQAINKLKCFFGFHWWLTVDDINQFSVHPVYIEKCGWCGKEREKSK